MSAFEDTCKLWQNALEHETVETVDGPTSIETLLEARDRFTKLGNEPRNGCLVISLEMAREIPRGWVEIEHDTVSDDHEEFRPFEEMVAVTERVESREAFICRSDAVRLDMTIAEPTGVVAIDFKRGDTPDVE
ncbi:hypothetical protein HTZ84_05095 [Haloterrigena sp. SYSU A558-1]|uniref:PD-(D/E)XK endonuclease-like domain-containing protein n=1 Tax=Haloterrigena gelatinilytica TaxID=2741724 RepID=A0ABX2L928_9EURY|nr:hypothetical protein [Haloterrigena gelatinilytica]NUC71689.1 hypothetical protein [Haloterrigena gelatinilytica]